MAVNKQLGSIKRYNVMTSEKTICFSRRTVCHGLSYVWL